MSKFRTVVTLSAAPWIGSCIKIGGDYYIATAASRLDDSEATKDFNVDIIGPYANNRCAMDANGSVSPVFIAENVVAIGSPVVGGDSQNDLKYETAEAVKK